MALRLGFRVAVEVLALMSRAAGGRERGLGCAARRRKGGALVVGGYRFRSGQPIWMIGSQISGK